MGWLRSEGILKIFVPVKRKIQPLSHKCMKSLNILLNELEIGTDLMAVVAV